MGMGETVPALHVPLQVRQVSSGHGINLSGFYTKKLIDDDLYQ